MVGPVGASSANCRAGNLHSTSVPRCRWTTCDTRAMSGRVGEHRRFEPFTGRGPAASRHRAFLRRAALHDIPPRSRRGRPNEPSKQRSADANNIATRAWPHQLDWCNTPYGEHEVNAGGFVDHSGACSRISSRELSGPEGRDYFRRHHSPVRPGAIGRARSLPVPRVSMMMSVPSVLSAPHILPSTASISLCQCSAYHSQK
jgi:hypothetical protein